VSFKKGLTLLRYRRNTLQLKWCPNATGRWNIILLLSVTQKCSSKEHDGGGKRQTQTEANFCWMRSSLVASVNVIEFKISEAYSNLHLTNVKYTTYRYSREETVKVMERIRPNSFNLIYLHASLSVQRSFTKWTRVRRTKQQQNIKHAILYNRLHFKA
jgi:hypothetical protein